MKTTPLPATLLLFLILSLGLAGCTTTSSSSRPDRAKAAEYNAKLGAGYLQRGRYDLAKEYLEKALKKDQNSSMAQHYYALLQEKLGRDDQANLYFRRALKQDGKNPDLLNNFGTFLCKQGQYQEAVTAFLRAASDPLYKTPAFAYTNAGICLEKQGRKNTAEAYFRKALTYNNKFPLALYNLAQLAHEQNENAKAQAFLYRYNELAPSSPETLLLCYRIHKSLHEDSKAENCVNNLLARFPDSPEASELN
ncbi:MAG TPA: type IV pilus biogenesis/stability protein PilW [Thiolinea sp.]|nr:type IV pilus biogenesis/stability protein PilW [Thiolinea sp.]